MWGKRRKRKRTWAKVAAAATLEGVPTEVLYLILGHLPPHELCRVALVCQRWHEAVADDFLWQRIHSALIAPCEQQSATASAAAADGEVSAPPAGRVWRQRCVEVACALQKYFGLELGQEADFTLSLSLTETKKIERVYPNLLWAVNYGYARIVERLLARMVALCPSAKPTSGGVVASLVNYKWRNTIFPNYNYPEWFEATLYESIVRYNDSLLHVAARKGFTMIVLRILISHKAAVDSLKLPVCGSTTANVGHRQTQSRRNVLHEAVTTDRVALLEHLLALSSSSADDAVLRQWEDLTDQSDESGYTPLMLACKSGSVDMARLLRRVQVSAGGPERAANLSNAVALSRASNHAEALLALFPAEALRDDAAEAPPHDPHLE
ncbi:Fbox domain containing protein [Acanthamoeba castellanii str. Neff]|uniref:Fbox domain containing protein n=1 Tax=Acanthamoeba castellanii (strain ATCC 30010 / Neff) TaxID=1257118 RepID=L8HAH8_ACACF|nr:Fbox domain containing protein [Acanthamoeba castellanii str. Neff]ELR22247.1 Fbox domain containing protein [Acanthamoeba castellanii str. Neff]